MPYRVPADEDRRRNARFSCGGYAKITRLPSDGIFLQGKILDLSLGGCCIDTTLPIDCGVRAEIVVRVKAASFRAVGEVRALRGHSGAGMEFVHLSAGGKGLLADLVTDLARLQGVMKNLRSVRREVDRESFRRQLRVGELQARALRDQIPFVGKIAGVDSREPDIAAAAVSSENRIVEAQPLVIAIDLFG